jgi:hypothetical protein
VIDAPPRAVWDELRRIEDHDQWMRDAVAIRFTGDQREGVGTRFECDTAVGPLHLTDVMAVTEWRPRRAMGVVHEGVVAGWGRFELRRARQGRTRLTWTERLRFPWWLGGPVGARAARPVLRRIWRSNLAALATRVEHGPPR